MRQWHLWSACAFLSLTMATGMQGQTPGPSQDQALRLAPKDGGPRRWEVVDGDVALRRSPAGDAETARRLQQGAILHNMGCTPHDGQTWCHVRPLRGGEKGFVEGTYLGVVEGPDGIVAMGANDSKTRARKRKFDAKTQIRCSQEQGQSLGNCTAGVARSGGGDAAVAVTFANGFTRSLYFVHGEFLSASSTMSGVGTDNDWTVDGDTHVVRVDDQRYIIPVVFVLGE